MASDRDSDPQQLIKDVRWLRDRQEILDCINRYGRGLDRLDADLIASTYHSDALDNHGPFTGPAAEFVKFAIEVEAQFGWTHHGITSHNCQVNGDQATAESYVYWFVRMPDGVNVGGGGGRYLDQLERRDGEWRLSLRRLLMDWSFLVPYDGWLGPQWDNVKGTRDRKDPSYDRPLRLPAELQAALAAKLKQQTR